MTEIKITFNSDGFRQILNGAGVKQEVTRAAEKIQAQANANLHSEHTQGFAVKTWRGGYGGGRWIASVMTTDHATMVAQSEDKALSRAVN